MIMKNKFLSTLVMLFVLGQTYGQSPAIAQNKIQLKVYDGAGAIVSESVFQDNQPAAMNLEQLINEAPADERILLHGHYMKNDIKYSVFYSGTTGSSELCKSETQKFRPSLGIKGYSNENFSGLIIEEIVPESSAAQIGLSPRDVLYKLGEREITTYCDLRMAILKSEVGESIQIEYSSNGRMITDHIVLGANPYIHVTFATCNTDEDPVQTQPTTEIEDSVLLSEERKLSVFPNPTNGISHLKFDSSSEGSVSFLVLDSAGSLIHKEEVGNFFGSLRRTFDFEGLAAGAYYFVINQGNNSDKSKVLYMGQ